ARGGAARGAVRRRGPRSRVFQADARTIPGRPRERPPVVADADLEETVVSLRADLDRAAPGQGRDSVLDRILDQRLQDEVRHEGALDVLGDGVADGESVAEADLLDCEVALDERQLSPERDLGFRHSV